MSQAAALLARYPILSKIASAPKPALMGAASLLVALVVVLILWSRPPEYRTLFSNLPDKEGGAIVAALTQMGVPHRLATNGTAIEVPADMVHKTRLQLAEQGLPRSGDAGFELLDNTRFGASQFTEQITYQRALEGELASSIQAVHAVQSARVHLAMPRESLFVRDRQPPTASVLVTLYPGRSLSEAQVSAITWLISSSVPNLSSDNVSIVDQNGRLLTAPSGEAGIESTRRGLVNDIEQRTVQRIMTLLTPLVGAGNVRAQASADVDFAIREQTSEVYRPNQNPGDAAVRSEQRSAADQFTNNLPATGVPGALTNQPPPNAQAPIVVPPGDNANAEVGQPANAGDQNADNEQASQTGPANIRRDSTINYEVDRTISHVKDPVGQLRRLSVAVVLNYQPNQEGEYVPLPQETLDSLNSLVRDAMGYSAERGDTVSIINSPFSESMIPPPPVWKNPEYHALALKGLEYLLIAIALFIFWRKIGKPAIESLSKKTEETIETVVSATEGEDEMLQRASDITKYEDRLKLAREMAEKDPRAVAMVIRSWMEKQHGKS
ncbi:MAG: flagellar basal-body MS-ring/collar protein FliF [Pusillimonas sp.]